MLYSTFRHARKQRESLPTSQGSSSLRQTPTAADESLLPNSEGSDRTKRRAVFRHMLCTAAECAARSSRRTRLQSTRPCPHGAWGNALASSRRVFFLTVFSRSHRQPQGRPAHVRFLLPDSRPELLQLTPCWLPAWSFVRAHRALSSFTSGAKRAGLGRSPKRQCRHLRNSGSVLRAAGCGTIRSFTSMHDTDSIVASPRVSARCPTARDIPPPSHLVHEYRTMPQQHGRFLRNHLIANTETPRTCHWGYPSCRALHQLFFSWEPLRSPRYRFKRSRQDIQNGSSIQRRRGCQYQ